VAKAYRDAARECYGGEDLNIDEDARLSVGEHHPRGGAWVQAWVWIEQSWMEDELTEEQP
jgi:hypothetical protein